MATLDSIYAKLPAWVQHAAVTAYGAYWKQLRFGGEFAAEVASYASRDRATLKQLEQQQRNRLREVLGVCATCVPYYKKAWTREQLDAAQEGELDRLPLLDKEPLRLDPLHFVRDDAAAQPSLVFFSSGSTGTPIASYWTRAELRRAMALREVRSARWAGVSFQLPRATFSGRMVEPDPRSSGPFYRYNAAERQVYMSPFHLRAETAALYVRALERHGVQWLTGYAVSYYLLARFILQRKLRVPPLKAVVTTSEKTTSEMRRVMEEAYGCHVFEEYSTVESALFASECERGSLHVSSDACVVEILRPDGSTCSPDESGEVVATCLLRDHQPLIRFRLGDVAAWSGKPCSCGRAMPVLKEVVGRTEDVVVGPDGRQMVRFHGIFTEQPRVKLGQVVQEAIDRIRLRVVCSDSFGERDEHDLMARVHQRLGPNVEVIVERVDRIPLSSAGKFQAVISKFGPSLDDAR